MPKRPVLKSDECTSTRPCIEAGTGDSGALQDSRDPDYFALQGTILIAAASLIADRYGNVYLVLGANAGSSIIVGGSGALVGGWVESPFDSSIPSESQIEDFLQGPAITLSGGVIGGGGINWSPWAISSGDAFASDRFSHEIGAYTPQIGVTAAWGFKIIDIR
jgi:hypothetical protein